MSIFDKIKKKPTVRIEDVPCYQCICLPLCRHKDLGQLMKLCPDVVKYLRKKTPNATFIFESPDYSRLMNFLKKDQVSRK